MKTNRTNLIKLPKHYFALFYFAGAVLVWTIFYFEVKHIRKLSSVYVIVISM